MIDVDIWGLSPMRLEIHDLLELLCASWVCLGPQQIILMINDWFTCFVCEKHATIEYLSLRSVSSQNGLHLLS